jgi:hypothetical protein
MDWHSSNLSIKIYIRRINHVANKPLRNFSWINKEIDGKKKEEKFSIPNFYILFYTPTILTNLTIFYLLFNLDLKKKWKNTSHVLDPFEPNLRHHTGFHPARGYLLNYCSSLYLSHFWELPFILYIVGNLATRRTQLAKLHMKWINDLGEIKGENISVRNSIGAI